MTERVQWAARIGLVLAMAGNAVGLGHFLRFPRQAAVNGGGTFRILPRAPSGPGRILRFRKILRREG